MYYVILFYNLVHIFFIISIVFLYMFRALLWSTSGGLNYIYTASGPDFVTHLRRVTKSGTRSCIDTINPPEDEHISARNM